MKWFYNMRIGVKLTASFIVVALITAIVGIIGVTNINKMDELDTQLYENMTVPLSEVAEMATLFQRARVNARDLIFLTDPDEVEEVYDKIRGFLDEMTSYEESFRQTITADEIRVQFEAYLKAMEGFDADLEELRAISLRNDQDAAWEFTKDDLQSTSDEVRVALETLVNMKIQAAKQQSATNSNIADSSNLLMIVVIIVSVVIAVGLGLFISSAISRPLKKLLDAADKIATGDLDVYIDIDTKEEIGNLARAFNMMADNLNEVVSNINVAAEQVAGGSKQVADSSLLLSQGATEQASTIEQLTASIEEIAAQTRQNAENSVQANSLADIAKQNALQGNTQMNDMLKAMDEINVSSNNISKIIKVIDDIAFQTNMLALNAAVEAARAGQHGRGFAVVAEEVRNLAARSANAAKETTEMIEGSIKNVVDGTAIAKKTSDALNKIVEDVSKVATLIGDIAVASNEQSSGIAQVNEGIMLMSEVVQKNSATSEESAAASEELSSQAQNLKEQVAKFRLRSDNTFFRARASLNAKKASEQKAKKSAVVHTEEAEDEMEDADEEIVFNNNASLKY